MSYPHPIRLRGPWQCQPLMRAGAGPLPPPSRMFPPCTWESACGSDFFGTVRFTRAFHPPSRLDPHERVRLVVEGADARGDVTLNAHYLGTVDGYALPASWDITELLRSSNELAIDVECLNDASDVGRRSRLGRECRPGGLTGEVRLEIRSSAFVDDLAVWAVRTSSTVTLMLSGTIFAPAGRNSLAVNGLRRELLYAEVAAGRFNVEASVPDLPAWPFMAVQPLAVDDVEFAELEIKLILGATAAWQTRLRTAAAPPARVTEDRGLSIAGRPTAWPTIVIEPPDSRNQLPADLRQSVQGARLVAMRGIADASVYEWFDRSPAAIVQVLPGEWLSRVGPRLAHHPSIIAWAPVGKPTPGEQECERAFGRPIVYRSAM